MVEYSLTRPLVHIGVLSINGAVQFSGASNVTDAPVKRAAYSMDDPDLFIYAQRPGFFAPTFRLGDVAEKRTTSRLHLRQP